MTEIEMKRMELENEILELIDLASSGEVTQSDIQGMVGAFVMKLVK